MRAYVQRVYAWMMGGLLTTAVVAMAVVNSDLMLAAIFGTPIRWVVLIAPLAMVWYLSARIESMKASTAIGLFMAYSMMNGLAFGPIFLAYELGSIATVFAITAGMFGLTAAYGYVTKRDLSGMGGFMTMGLFGIILAMFVNWFLGSPALDFAISVIGVIVFTGLTAYDMQRIKEEHVLMYDGRQVATKGAIMGALRLYLDFVNMFLFLLRLLGDRR
jgi:FtsH-binding integral membrane protein